MRSLSAAGSVITDESSPMTVPASATRRSVSSCRNLANHREIVAPGIPVLRLVAAPLMPARKHSLS